MSSNPLQERTNLGERGQQHEHAEKEGHCARAEREEGEAAGGASEMEMEMDALSRMEAREADCLLQDSPPASPGGAAAEGGEGSRKRAGEEGPADGEAAAGKRQRVPSEDPAAEAPCANRAGPPSYVQITAADGSIVTIRKLAPSSHRAAHAAGGSLFGGNSSHRLAREVERLRERLAIKESAEMAAVAERAAKEDSPPSEAKTASLMQAGRLWVDKYKPRNFLHLLSEERTNRGVLQWIKSWDKVVFGTEYKPPTGGGYHSSIDEAALDGKVILLHGPPGLGKTTLAHILAKTAGYSPVEINASDERSAAGLRTRLDALCDMQALLGDKRPNCVILDEIDGTTGSEGTGAIDVLLKLCANDARKDGGGEGGGRKTWGRSMFDDAEEEEEHEDHDDAVQAAPADGGKKGKGKGKKQARKPRKLNRPIICICNDLYAPSLRQLRAIAYTVKFQPPSEQKLITRLQYISAQEKLSIDRSALSLLYQMHAGDIRSCVNALQMVALQGRHITMKNVRSFATESRDGSMSTSIFDVWTAVFATRAPSAAKKDSKVVAKKQVDVKDLLRAHSSNMNQILNGCHHNYLRARYTDPRFVKTAKAMDAMADSDVLQSFIGKNQQWALMPHVMNAAVQVHLSCSTPQSVQIEYPKALGDTNQQLKQSTAMLMACMSGMGPNLRLYYTPRTLVCQAAPDLARILSPHIKLTNMHLMSAEDKQRLEDQMHIMVAFGLAYKMASREGGKTMLGLEPRIDELVRFPKHGDAVSTIPQDIMKHVQKMVEMYHIRKHQDESLITPNKASSPVKMVTTAKKILAPLEPSKALSFGHAGWGTASQHQGSSRQLATGCTNTFPVRFNFNEGITNAIKRPVFMKDLLSP